MMQAQVGSCWACPHAAFRRWRACACADARIVIRFDAPVLSPATLVAADTRQILVLVRDVAPVAGGDAAGLVSRIAQSKRESGARIAFSLARPAVIGDAGFGTGGRELSLRLQTASATQFAAAGETGGSSYGPLRRLTGGL